MNERLGEHGQAYTAQPMIPEPIPEQGRTTVKVKRGSMATQKRTAWTLFLFLLGVYSLTGAYRIDSGDGEAMYQVTRSLIERQDLAIPPPAPGTTVVGENGELLTVEQLQPEGWWPYGAWGRDGRYYAQYGIGWSLVAVPFYALGSGLAHLLPGAAEPYVTRAAVTLVNALALSMAGALFFLLALRLYPARTALLLALGYGMCTVAWSYARGTFSEPLVALGLLWAVLAAGRSKDEESREAVWWALAGLGLGGALLCRPAAAVMFLPFAAWAFLAGWETARVRGGMANVAAMGAPVALAVAIALGYNAVRFGGLLDLGYPQTIWNPNPLVGLYGMLLSPGKGLLLFAPVTLLGLVGWPSYLRRDPRQAGALLIMVLLQLGIYAFTRRAWGGGSCWGPRHLVPVLAFILLPAGEVWPSLLRKRWLELGGSLLLATSLVIQLLGISVNVSRHAQRVFATYGDFPTFFQRMNFTWTDSPIPGQVQALREVTAAMREPGSRELLQRLVDETLEADPVSGRAEAVGILAFNVPDFWFIYWDFLGVVTAWRVGVAVALALLTAWSAVRLRRLVAPV
jgi:hypothetical protein